MLQRRKYLFRKSEETNRYTVQAKCRFFFVQCGGIYSNHSTLEVQSGHNIFPGISLFMNHHFFRCLSTLRVLIHPLLTLYKNSSDYCFNQISGLQIYMPSHRSHHLLQMSWSICKNKTKKQNTQTVVLEYIKNRRGKNCLFASPWK